MTELILLAGRSWLKGVAFLGVVMAAGLLLLGAYRLTVHPLTAQIEAETLAADKAQAEMGTRFIADHQRNLLNRMTALAGRATFTEAFRRADETSLAVELSGLAFEIELEAVGVSRADGREIISRKAAGWAVSRGSPPIHDRPDQRGRRVILGDWSPGVIDLKRPYISRVQTSDAAGHPPILILIVPIVETGNEPTGFLWATQTTGYWGEFFSHLSARPGRTFHLVDEIGGVITGTPEYSQSISLIGLVRRLVNQDPLLEQAVSGVFTDPTSGRKVFLSAAKVPELGWTLVVHQDYHRVMAPLLVMFRNVTIFLVLFFGAILVAGGLMFTSHQRQKRILAEAGDEARRLESEVMARTADLHRSTKRVRELSRQLIRAQEEERQRLALDLHDEMGQLLSALKIGMQALAERRPVAVETQSAELRKLIGLSQKIMDRTRALAYNLRPAILDNFGLTAAVEDLCESVVEAARVGIRRQLAEVEEHRLSPEIKTTLFRFFQEGLTNALKYGGGSDVEVELAMAGRHLTGIVTDHGPGFDVDQALARALTDKKLGLVGMIERLDLVGGRLTITSSSQGTRLAAEIEIEDDYGT